MSYAIILPMVPPTWNNLYVHYMRHTDNIHTPQRYTRLNPTHRMNTNDTNITRYGKPKPFLGPQDTTSLCSANLFDMTFASL